MKILQRLWHKLSRLAAYVPVVWDNEEWDWTYLFRLLEFKLARMQREHEEDSYHKDADRYAQQIKVCRLLLQRLIADEYGSALEAEHDAKWGPLEMQFGKPDPKQGMCVTCHITRANRITPADEAKEHQEMKRIYAHQELQRRQDMALFCKILSRQYRSWWT